jgi:hypothetical protein
MADESYIETDTDSVYSLRTLTSVFLSTDQNKQQTFQFSNAPCMVLGIKALANLFNDDVPITSIRLLLTPAQLGSIARSAMELLEKYEGDSEETSSMVVGKAGVIDLTEMQEAMASFVMGTTETTPPLAAAICTKDSCGEVIHVHNLGYDRMMKELMKHLVEEHGVFKSVFS